MNNIQHLRQKMIRESQVDVLAYELSLGLQEPRLGKPPLVHTEDEVITLIQAFCRQCAVENNFYTNDGEVSLSRRVGVLVLAEATKTHGIKTRDINEPRVKYRGTVDIVHDITSTTEKAKHFLNELASTLVNSLNQSSAVIIFDGHKTIVPSKKIIQHLASIEAQ